MCVLSTVEERVQRKDDCRDPHQGENQECLCVCGLWEFKMGQRVAMQLEWYRLAPTPWGKVPLAFSSFMVGTQQRQWKHEMSPPLAASQ